MIKGESISNFIITLNVYVPNNKAPNVYEAKGERNEKRNDKSQQYQRF